jgi:plastocyanin
MKQRPLVGAIVLAIVVALVVLSGVVAVLSAQPQVHTVFIEGMRFQPEGLSVAAGDTVVWINRDMVPHTATSSGQFDSGDMAPGKSWTHTVRDTGEFSYICTYHPLMKGIVRVR